jgi:hypothetical protein
MATKATVKVTLLSNCGAKGSEGLPGDVVTMDKDLADRLIKRRGAKPYVPEEKPEPEKKPENPPAK